MELLAPSTLNYTAAPTIGAMLRERAEGPQGDDIRFLFVADDDVPPELSPEGEDRALTLSFRQALDLAQRGAAALQARGVEAGDRVLLMLPTGPSFLAAFHGCQLLGAVPVPVVPPTSLARMEDHLARIARIASICAAKAVVVGSQMMPVFSLVRSRHKEARHSLRNAVRSSDLLEEESALLDHVEPDPSDPAMIQFTSGSTGDPKGVVLPHSSLLANMRGIGEAAGFRPGDVCVAWLPLFHDMGLIGHFLCSTAWGMPLVLMPPEVFVRRPKEWLKAMSRYRGSASAAPNFAYSLCVKKVKDRDLAGVDLSSWRIAFCGAEPINPATVREFIDRYRPHGFEPTTFFPVYGMAEFALAATFPSPEELPRFDQVDRHAFEAEGRAVPSEGGESEADTIEWVSVGRALPGHAFRVVAPGTSERLPERRVGEVQVRGPSLMAGYYENPVATAEAFADGWLRTGDLGYHADGELFVTGRSKELIIKGGKNLYPQDVEAAAARVDGIRIGCCAAFGVSNPRRGTEDLVLICETRVDDAERKAALKGEVRTRVLEAIGATPDVILLVEPGTVPKTSSGKIQRDLMRRRYTTGDVRPGRPSLFTLVRLRVSAAMESIRARGLPSLLRRRAAAAS